MADAVHAVIPVTGAHQRQAMRTDAQAVVDGARGGFVQAGVLDAGVRHLVQGFAARPAAWEVATSS